MEKINKWVGHYRTFLSLCLGVAFLVFSKPTELLILWGLPVVLIGECIRIWASGYLNKDTSEYVTVFGPYVYTRNPLYVGNFFLGLGFILMAGQPLILLLFLILFFLIYYSTILDEEALMARLFGDAYLAYKSQVPRFFPTWNARRRAELISKKKIGFHWGQVVRREYKTWLGILAVFIFLLVRTKY